MTIAERKPGLYWRDVIRRAMPRAPSGGAALYAFCDEVYADEKRTLAELLARRAPASEIAGARLGVYVIALALVTYGRLDAVGDVLENLPPREHPARRGLAGAIRELLPVPEPMSRLDSPAEVLAWIRANEARLRWDDDAGRFVFRCTRAAARITSLELCCERMDWILPRKGSVYPSHDVLLSSEGCPSTLGGHRSTVGGSRSTLGGAPSTFAESIAVLLSLT